MPKLQGQVPLCPLRKLMASAIIIVVLWLFVCLTVRPTVCICACLTASLFICLSVCLSAHPSVCLHSESVVGAFHLIDLSPSSSPHP